MDSEAEVENGASKRGGAGLPEWAGRVTLWLASVYRVGSIPTGASEGARPGSEFARIWGRVVALFAGLVVVKLAMIVELRQHLYQTHWRLTERNAGPVDHLAFYALIALGAYGIVRIGRGCRDLPVSSARTANLWLLFLGGLGVFLSFSEGERNYLLPVMEGVLNYGDLWAYLSMNLFFRQPYLGAWILAYGAVWYVLIRTGKERRIFEAAAVFFAAYCVWHLRPLLSRGNDLLALAAFGCFGVVGEGKGAHAIRLAVALAACLATALVFLTVEAYEIDVPGVPAYPALLISEGGFLFGASVWHASRRGYLDAWLRFAPYLFLALMWLGSHHYPLSLNLNNLAFLGFTFTRSFVGEAALTTLLAAGLCFASRRRPGGSVLWFDVVAFLLLLVAVVDLKAVSTTGVRLDWGLLTMCNSPKMIWRMALPYLPAAALALALGIGGYALVVRLAIRRGADLVEQTLNRRHSVWLPFLAPLALLTLVGMLRTPADKSRGIGVFTTLATSPLVKGLTHDRYTREEFEAIAAELKLLPQRKRGGGKTPVRAPGDRLSLFLIIMESSYNRHLSLFGCEDETQPLLSAYKERMELFPNIYCNYPTSNHARFSVFTGLLAPKPNVTYINPRIPTASVFEIFHARGYRTAAFDSCFLDYVRFRDFLGHRDIEVLHDCDTMPGRENHETVSWGVREECTRDAIIRQIEEYARSGEDFVLTYLPVAPHYPYDTLSARFDKFDFLNGVVLKNDYTGRYKNQLLYMDWIIASMIDALRDNGVLDRTLVVITNDHGEMLGDNEAGNIGHGWSLAPHLSNIPLIVMDPRRPGYRVNQTLGSQIDVMPTILDIMDTPASEGELLQGVSLHDKSANEGKVVRLNSHRQRGVVRGDRYIVESAEDPKRVEVYRISHEGTKTVFEPIEEKAEIGEEMDRFEKFQESFILNYSYYKDLMREPAR